MKRKEKYNYGVEADSKIFGRRGGHSTLYLIVIALTDMNCRAFINFRVLELHIIIKVTYASIMVLAIMCFFCAGLMV